MENRGKSRNRSVNPVWVVINMRDSDRIYIVDSEGSTGSGDNRGHTRV